MKFAKRMQQKQEEQGEEFAKSVKVNLTKKVAACQEMLELEQQMLELEQVLEVCVGNVA